MHPFYVSEYLLTLKLARYDIKSTSFKKKIEDLESRVLIFKFYESNF